jgi:hypothetical protein
MIVGDSADVISNDDRGYVYQVYAGNPGAAITVSVYSKSTNSKTGYMQFLDAAPGVHANIWDNVADTWDPLVTTVTDLPGTSNSLTCSGTASYVINTETLTIPASGTLCVVLMSDKGDNTTQQTYFFDTLVMTTNVSAGATTLFDFENGSDATNLDVGDAIMDYRTTGGAPASQWKLGGTGVLESSLVAIDYSAIPFIFADPTQDGNPVTKTYFESIVPVNIQSLAISQLGSVAVDYKSTGQTTIYTVPTGFLLRGFYTETKTTAADAVANDSLARMGTSGGGYVDVTGTIVQPSSTIGNVVRSSLTGTTDIAAGGVIQVDVTTADTGTDLDAIVYLYGILISV